MMGGSGGGGPEGVGGPKGWGPEPRKSGSPKVWWPGGVGVEGVEARTQKKLVARRVGAEGWGAQNFALFFSLPPEISFFLLSLGGLLVEFWWCLKRRGAQMCTFGVLGLS